MKSLVAREKVYIKNDDGQEELYDLNADPGELRNLVDAPAHRPDLERLRSDLHRILGEEPPVERVRGRRRAKRPSRNRIVESVGK